MPVSRKKPTGKFDANETAFKIRVRAIRKIKGLNMNEAARLIGISRKQLEDLETLRDYGRYIDLKIIYAIADAYELEPWELLYEGDDFGKTFN